MTDSTDNALKPCPFCGENPYTREVQDEDLSTHDTVTWKFVGCWNCDISFGIPDGYDCGTAAEQWNRRADLAPDPLRAVKVNKDSQSDQKAVE